MYKTASVSLKSSTWDNKVACIKGIRGLTGMGLKESKCFVEGLSDKPETITIHTNISPGDFNAYSRMARDGGIVIQPFMQNTPVRQEIKEQINGVISYASLSKQYDLARALMLVLEDYFPQDDDETWYDASGDPDA